MKIMCRLLAFSLLAFTLLLPLGYAQDYITWGLPEGAKSRFGKGAINSLKLSPDGTRLAVGSATGIWLYDTNTGAELALLTGHIDSVGPVSFSSDGRTLVSGSYGEIFLWDIETQRILKILEGHKGWVGNLGISEDSETLVSTSSDGTVRFWDVQSGRQLKTFKAYPRGLGGFLASIRDGEVTAAAFCPEKQFFALGYPDGTIRLKDARTGRVTKTINGHKGHVARLTISPDGQILVSDINGDKTRLWDIATGKSLQTFPEAFSFFGGALLFTPDGKTLVIVDGLSRKNKVEFWDVDTVSLRAAIKGDIGKIRALTSPADCKTLVTGSSDGTIRLWDVATGAQLKVIASGHNSQFTHLAFSPNGAMLAAGADTTVRIWDTRTGTHLFTSRHLETAVQGSETFGITTPIGQILKLVFSTDSTKLYSVNSFISKGSRVLPNGERVYGEIRSWDIGTGDSENAELIRDVSVLPLTEEIGEGAYITVEVKLENGIKKAVTYTSFPGLAEFASDRRMFACKGRAALHLWDATTGNVRLTFKDPGGIKALAFTSDGKTLASAGGWRENTIRFWDTTTGEQISRITTAKHSQWIHELRWTFGLATSWSEALAFSPGGKILASGSDNGRIQLWEAGTMRKLFTLKGHTDYVKALNFSPDGEMLASSGAEGKILLWQANTGKRLGTLKGHGGWIKELAFSPNGQTLASASEDGLVFLWDVSRFIRP